MNFNIVFVGDIVGEPGRRVLKDGLDQLRNNRDLSLIIANAENAAGGKGITPKTAEEIFKSGVDVITLGNHVWKWKEVYTYLNETENILRPANFKSSTPGHGWCIVNDKCGNRAGVINVQGRVYMDPSSCPFFTVDDILQKNYDKADYWIVDIHAEATSEKNAMGYYLDGRVLAVIGTHTHIQTADERILPDGTAYITDAGMTGSHNSILGMDKKNVLKHFLTGMPHTFNVAKTNLQLRGVMINIDSKSFKPNTIERICIKFC